MKPRANPTHLDSQDELERVKGVKDTWIVLLLFAGITLTYTPDREYISDRQFVLCSVLAVMERYEAIIL